MFSTGKRSVVDNDAQDLRAAGGAAVHRAARARNDAADGLELRRILLGLRLEQRGGPSVEGLRVQRPALLFLRRRGVDGFKRETAFEGRDGHAHELVVRIGGAGAVNGVYEHIVENNAEFNRF